MSMAMHFCPVSREFFDRLCLADETKRMDMIGESDVQDAKFGVEQFQDVFHYLLTGKPCPLLRLPISAPAKGLINKFVPADVAKSEPLRYAIGGGFVFPHPLEGLTFYLDTERVHLVAEAIKSLTIKDLFMRWDFEQMKKLGISYIESFEESLRFDARKPGLRPPGQIDPDCVGWMWKDLQGGYAKAAGKHQYVIKYFA
jgi:hypothetical protein